MTLVLHHVTEWRLRAACRGADTRLFFPGPNDATVTAKTYCQRCDVQAACLEDAMSRTGCDFGIRGGMSERERRREAKKRRARGMAA